MINPTLSIGVAAFNEEANIAHLLKTILDQKIESVLLMEIIVVSDASSDKTDEIVGSFADPRIHLVRQEKRMGQNMAQNKIAKTAKGDVLIILDADILLPHVSSVEEIIAPIISKKADMVSVSLQPLAAGTYVESVISWSQEVKLNIFKKCKQGNNVYLCFGPARAFSRACYTAFEYPDNCPNDAYSYFAILELGFRFLYHDATFVWFRNPMHTKDHIKQSVRFAVGKNALKNIFGAKRIEKEYALPMQLVIRESLQQIFSHPIKAFGYGAITCLSKIKSSRRSFNAGWDMATSSKKLI